MGFIEIVLDKRGVNGNQIPSEHVAYDKKELIREAVKSLKKKGKR